MSSSIVVTTSTIVTVEEAVKLDEINREIQARKMEIAGMLNVDPDSLVRKFIILIVRVQRYINPFIKSPG